MIDLLIGYFLKKCLDAIWSRTLGLLMTGAYWLSDRCPKVVSRKNWQKMQLEAEQGKEALAALEVLRRAYSEIGPDTGNPDNADHSDQVSKWHN